MNLLQQKHQGLALILAVVATTGCQTLANPAKQHVNEVASYLMGVMDTSAQAKAIPDAPSVRMTTCSISIADADASTPTVFLYQEQALMEKLSKPYRQRILRISPSEDNQNVESASFKPVNPKAWIGLCKKPESDRVWNMKDIENANCTVFLKAMGSHYLGETQPGGCATNFRGAAKITNTIKLDAKGMDTQDRGFDAQGKQVWGAENRPYQFRKIQ